MQLTSQRLTCLHNDRKIFTFSVTATYSLVLGHVNTFPVLIHDSYTRVGVQFDRGAAENAKNGNYRPKEVDPEQIQGHVSRGYWQDADLREPTGPRTPPSKTAKVRGCCTICSGAKDHLRQLVCQKT